MKDGEIHYKPIANGFLVRSYHFTFYYKTQKEAEDAVKVLFENRDWPPPYK